MNIIQFFIIAFALLSFNLWQLAITGYWKLPRAFFTGKDIFGDSHHALLEKIKRRFLSTWTIPVCLTGLVLALTPSLRWDMIDPNHLLMPIILIASGTMTWRAITMDAELATRTSYPIYRVYMALSWIGVWFHPGFLIILLHIGITWLRSNYHHQHLSIRVLIMFLACSGALQIISFTMTRFYEPQIIDFTAPVLFLFLCLSGSPYFVAAMRKVSLGPNWYSWMLDNHLSSISMSAYLWGWLRFIPENLVIKFIRLLRPFDRFFQIPTFFMMLGSVLILFDQWICIVLITMFLIFHIMVTVLTGIFFWQVIAVNSLILWAVWNLPPDIVAQLFGFKNGLIAAAIFILLPYKGKVWKPPRLGWWDTSFSCKVHYEVQGKSGTWYGLYNDFMCPNERIFGQTYGDFLSDEKRINTHVGETHSRNNFDALNLVGEDLLKLAQVKEDLGSSKFNSKRIATHDRYIQAFFKNFNSGFRKRRIPFWLKAPGGQLFYWGKLPGFSGQESIDKLVIYYREYYFDGQRVVLVTERIVKEFGVNELYYKDALTEGS